jgi:hypothetical protein
MIASAIRRSPGKTLGVCGTALIHLLVLGNTFDSAMPGSRYRVSNESIQTTFYVGLGQAHAGPTAPNVLKVQELPGGADEIRRGSGVLGTPAPRNRWQHHGKDLRDEKLSNFFPPADLDISALPVTEPDYSLLNGFANSHLPIKLRLFIDTRGKIVDIQVLQADERDNEAATRIRAMFFIAKFLPGRLNRKDVPSFLDVEVNIDDTFGSAPSRPN